MHRYSYTMGMFLSYSSISGEKRNLFGNIQLSTRNIGIIPRNVHGDGMGTQAALGGQDMFEGSEW